MRLLAVLAALVLVLPAVAPAVAAPSTPDAADGADGAGDGPVTLLVRWAEGVAPTDRAATRRGAGVADAASVRAVSDRVDAVEVAAPAAAAVADALEDRVEVLVVARDRTIRLPAPGAVDPDGADAGSPGRALAVPDGDTADADAHVASASTTAVVPPAQLFDQQWGLRNTGQWIGPVDDEGTLVEGVEGVDVDAVTAWEETFGDPGVVVGVIDTAMDLDHPELADSIIGEVDLRDPELGDGLSRSHGTQVASVIAAGSEQGGTMLGLAPEVSILSLAAFTELENGGESTMASILAAFDAARQAEVDVINASWVGMFDRGVVSLADDGAVDEFGEAEAELLEAAIAEAGVPVVAASGNEGLDLASLVTPPLPVGFDLPNLVSVTAVDPEGQLPHYANTGRGVVDVAAPGEWVAVTLPDGEGYALARGTSFAAPFVAAAVALGRGVEPTATTSDLVDAVRWTSSYRDNLSVTTTTGGMLDAGALVAGVPRPVCGADHLDAGFADVSANSVHAPGIDCIAAQEITLGRADGTYDPSGTVSRAQMATFLTRVIERVVDDLPDPEPAGFEDVDPDSEHAASIDRLADLDIVQGDADNRYRPTAPVRRGQIAAMLMRTVDVLVALPAPPTRAWFDDVAGTTHAEEIDRARDYGLVRGVATTTFDPGSSTRRDQMATLLARTLDALARDEVLTP